jgi:hypothetical protein
VCVLFILVGSDSECCLQASRGRCSITMYNHSSHVLFTSSFFCAALCCSRKQCMEVCITNNIRISDLVACLLRVNHWLSWLINHACTSF